VDLRLGIAPFADRSIWRDSYDASPQGLTLWSSRAVPITLIVRRDHDAPFPTWQIMAQVSIIEAGGVDPFLFR